MSAFALVSAITALLAQAEPANAVTARSFLEAFAANPKQAKKFTTKDAMMVMGDIGGRFDDYARIIVRQGNFLAGCGVSEVKKRAGLSADEQKNPDIDPRMMQGSISAFDGSYSCPRPDGSTGKIEFTVVLRNDRVLDFYLGGNR